MPTITINRKSFEKFARVKLSTDKLKDRISMLGTDLERIDENEIEVEIFPNRPDLLSVPGFARAFSSFIGKDTGLRKYNVIKSNERVIIDKSVAGVRPYTACAIVKGMRFTDERIKEVIQIQEKLHITYGRNRRKAAIGIYPFEKIKTPISYTAKNPKDIIFRPLEYPREINAEQIIHEHPTGKEYGHLLQGYDKYPAFIDAEGKVLSVPPIVNSHDTGKIDSNTSDVFIECSGSDFNVLKKCLNMIVAAMADMGGRIYSMELEYPDNLHVTPCLEPEKMKIDIDYCSKRLGIDFGQKEIKSLLERMGFGYDEKTKTALIPAYRADILHQIDLVEDISIAYGFENFKEEIPNVQTTGQEDLFAIFNNKITDILAGLGMQQINSSYLTKKESQKTKMQAEIEVIELKNALSAEFNVLRTWVVPSLLECFSHNRHCDYPQKIFDIGAVFKHEKSDTAKSTMPISDTGVIQNTRLGAGICSENADYTQIRQVFDYLMRMINVKCRIEETEHPSFIPGRVARAYIGKKGIAYIGELHPKVIRNWGIEMPVCAFELNLSDLFEIIAQQN